MEKRNMFSYYSPSEGWEEKYLQLEMLRIVMNTDSVCISGVTLFLEYFCISLSLDKRIVLKFQFKNKKDFQIILWGFGNV